MASIGQIVNIETYKNANANRGVNMTPIAKGSAPGEDNSLHVAGLVILVGVVVLVAGLINVQVGASIGRHGG